MTAIDETTTAELSAEQQQRLALLDAYRALNEMIGRVPLDIRIDQWRLQHTGIEALVSPPWNATDDETRDIVRRLAEAARLEYAEKRHSDAQNMVTASGTIYGIPVKFWQLVKPCPCPCPCHSAVTS